MEYLQTVVEAVVENYAEYKDFNTTTTQSDHGELLYTLLDFLRLKASNERVCWNIRPIVQAHEILIRRGQLAAAELWRRALAEQTTETADALLKQASVLTERYQMRLPSITARLAERFVRPLAVDGMRALVIPAIDEVRTMGPGDAFARLNKKSPNLPSNRPAQAWKCPRGYRRSKRKWCWHKCRPPNANRRMYWPVACGRPPCRWPSSHDCCGNSKNSAGGDAPEGTRRDTRAGVSSPYFGRYPAWTLSSSTTRVKISVRPNSEMPT